ncbi:MAG TPA: NAD(P)H-hydrate epimerase [Elusimicrobia bacterium]|nr:MAG: NAD(P)H-hydrate epimerase [Elusimicrobia bacterium RIFOXYA12_FULL_49_49]OGS10042.1 MAG: NAD(P)H-hydrate epimerase [Elusimicrobia bacterium RIFOXYA1_FULL_47_7]OGS10593.1 MAG: NAD(P)H-hydrate epimerase [Elusimicrobia bacterium RIFOXYB1_FULL_48_9]OGS16058.1 MAG: NAD(P)H-hydrate epimerase [Elusimicrobia bacterium RIFOXYA2_FULL_47_53]OGS26683.1 MAG: NAD(P)H-hydrate epimerase [Elusimicrobia bacterium RIFOXYB12_FULL_50_12]OGS30190.1 MAG: NAD(P)H-hydrate epimerase [Elusimicrobia bacterium RIFO
MKRNNARAVTSGRMREIDARASKDFSVPPIILMENAGRASADAAERMLGRNNNVAVFCGSGNNAGDGFVCARHLYNRGYNTTIILLRPASRFKYETKVNFEIVRRMGLKRIAFSKSLKLNSFGLIIDAMLGTGTSGRLSVVFSRAVELINRSKRKVLSLDIPTGISADTGELLGPAVKADATLTMGLLKSGMLKKPGRDYCGKISVAEISLPKQLVI